jgi:hypothetical protein
MKTLASLWCKMGLLEIFSFVVIIQENGRKIEFHLIKTAVFHMIERPRSDDWKCNTQKCQNLDPKYLAGQNQDKNCLWVNEGRRGGGG